MIKKSRICFQSLFALLGGLVLHSFSSAAQGELLFSDSFQYPAGPLAGQGPPEGAPAGQTGWSNIEGQASVAADGLSYKGLLSSGGAASLLGRTNDEAVAYLTPVTSGVVWLGFLMNLTNRDDLGFAVINLVKTFPLPPGYGVLFNAQVFGIDNGDGGPGSEAFTTVSPGLRPTWLVVSLDFETGQENLYLDPPRGVATPAQLVPSARLQMTRKFRSEGFDHLYLHVGSNTGEWQFDEVRIGTSFSDIR